MKKQEKILAAAVVLISLNLRAALTAVGPLVGRIQADLQIGEATAGILTTLPVLMYAVGAPCTRWIVQKLGAWSTMLTGLALLCIGLVVRSWGAAGALLGGVILVGLGISALNVLLPALIRVCFPEKIGLMTGLYSTGMSVSAALGAGLSIPIAVQLGLGWPAALGIWVITAGAALLVWLTQRRAVPGSLFSPPEKTQEKLTPILRSGKAWAVALFMGLQSMLFYVFVAWLSTILQAKGLSEAGAGYLSSVFQLVTIPASFLVPVLASGIRNQSRFARVIAGGYVGALALLLVGRGMPLVVLAVVLCALCSGSVVSLAMAFISRRASTPARAIQLSAMAQGIGYAIASAGPYLLGKFFEVYGSWQTASAGLLIIAGCLFAVSGPAASEEKI